MKISKQLLRHILFSLTLRYLIFCSKLYAVQHVSGEACGAELHNSLAIGQLC